MNAKEAKADTFKHRGVCVNIEEETIAKYWKAKGYLEALNGPEVAAKDAAYAALDKASRALVEFVRNIPDHLAIMSSWRDSLADAHDYFSHWCSDILVQIEEARK